MKNIVLCLTIIFFSSHLLSQGLYFKNNSSSPVDMAFAIKNNSKNNKAWYSEGWFHCEPRQRIKINSAVGLHKYIYFYAKSTDGRYSWGGRDNSKRFLVDSDGFEIKNADLQYIKDRNPSYQWESFRRRKIGLLEATYTIEITD